jgi:hypothetical protein
MFVFRAEGVAVQVTVAATALETVEGIVAMGTTVVAQDALIGEVTAVEAGTVSRSPHVASQRRLLSVLVSCCNIAPITLFALQPGIAAPVGWWASVGATSAEEKGACIEAEEVSTPRRRPLLIWALLPMLDIRSFNVGDVYALTTHSRQRRDW